MLLPETKFEMQNKIIIEGLRLHAFHGVMEQERKVGADFIIHAEIDTDFSEAMKHDDLSGTINYADLFQTIKREMSIPSKLVEHAAGRIAQAILSEYVAAKSIRLKLLKVNPPMGADCMGAGVEVVLP